MTKDEALKMAIETNNWLKSELWVDMLAGEELDKVTNACKEALEQPSWQGLDMQEIGELSELAQESLIKDGLHKREYIFEFAYFIEQALRERNT
jgi:hypothetical protein